MQTGAITGYMDVAQVALYVFWLFFAGLIFYLRKEDKREGYPLVTDREGVFLQGFPVMPAPKTFLLPQGGTVMAPRVDPPEPAFEARPVALWPGAPMHPLGNAMLSGAGPASFALRADMPDLMQETSTNRVVPLRVAKDYSVDEESPDPLGKPLVGADGVVGGTIVDLWIDLAESAIRYVEVTLPAGTTVLVPMPLVRFQSTGQGVVESVLGSQFAAAPRIASPDQITLREEDKIQAYFASGHMYAMPSRVGPLL
jgi:photosynthetic reaction center H subunit